MTRVLYVITTLDRGGAPNFLARVATGLGPRFERRVVVLQPPGPVADDLAPIPVDSLHMRSWRDVDRLSKLYDVAASFAPDVVHSYLFHADLLSTLSRAAPRVITSAFSTVGRAWYFWAERFIGRRSDAIVAASNFIRDYYVKRCGLPREKFRVIHNGVPEPAAPHDLRPELGLAPDAKLVATATRIVKGKGVDDFVDVAARIPEATFVVLGDGPERARLEAGAPANVRFLGMRRDVVDILARCDVFAHLSRLGEGLPNAVLEAMMAGCAVVATDAGGTREAVPPPLVRPGDVEGAVRLVRERLREPVDLRAIAREKFSLPRMVRDYEALYTEPRGTDNRATS